MRSTFHNLEVAKRGLYAQQTAMSTTGHNISNANTEGYSRQRVNFKAATPIETPSMTRSTAPGQLGTGVDFQSITRIREAFLDVQYRNESQAHGTWQVQKDTLEKIEGIYNEPSEEGLRSVIDEFWNGWQELSREADNLTARSVVKERALAMTDAFKHTDSKLQDLRDDLDHSLDVKTQEANTYIDQVAHLNQEIRRVEGLGHNANDLRDQRDLAVDKLSELVQINVQEEQSGMYSITLPDGTDVVNGMEGQHIGDGISVDQITGGEIYGIVVSRDELVNEYQTHLNTMFQGLLYGEVEVHIPEGSVLAQDIEYGPEDNRQTWPAGEPIPEGGMDTTVEGINGLHQLGWTLREDDDGNAIPGEAFFLPADEEDFNIQDVELNPYIAKDVGLIAASLRVEEEDGMNKVIRGNGDLALAMGQLRDGVFQFQPEEGAAGEGTFDEYFRSVIGGLGVKTQEATRQTDNQEMLLNAADNRRQSVSGVSLDEEMSNMIKFQHAYNAAARMVTATDELLDTVVNRMGLVGR
ncbi:flagellar hook-associated protein FlgK [Caldalkalibacillus salinus]|uniref:flagellar hook-associated protein FlgK n=1 Tax=Caldalkalibacillus salinus TaxID=2803787 RepID=UPI001922CA0C